MIDPQKIRNFCIIAHIDHGKSTLADRLLEITGTVPDRAMRQQLLDQMDIERERGITVKLAPVRMKWREFELNLIDTPGHVDFSYEVSRSLAAVEGAILVVDASQGIQAQTLANLSMAKDQGLTIIPVINKIDLPNADVNKTGREISHILNIDQNKIIRVSGKTGENVEALLDRIVTEVPPPRGRINAPLRALIFDSLYDSYQGVIAYVRVVDGRIKLNTNIRFIGTKAKGVCLGVGVFKPQREKSNELTAGEIGYVVTGLKEISRVNVGDTIASQDDEVEPLPGYRRAQPMVYAGFFPPLGHDAKNLRQALEKLKLNDAALFFEPENSPAIGSGFRCGFLGLLHLDIIRERLSREYGLTVIMTTPSVAYRVYQRDRADYLIIRSPLELPDPSSINHLEEPLLKLEVLSPSQYIGAIMEAADRYRGVFQGLDYLDLDRAIVHFHIPLASILVDFYDTIKSASNGYATVDYHLSGYQRTDVVRLDILIAGRMMEALATMVCRDAGYQTGRRITARLKSVLPRQMFEVKIQAAIGGQIIASETLPAMRKDVTAKLYGGDVTRKRKLLEKQKRGKKKMKERGQIDIPQAAYFEVLKNSR